ncbi:alpha-ketoacid dehydrogenase subunit beta [Lysinibacillus yapensis]|uniref:Alpha-ketoacid dehydrogenase subunit beta n=1 Tax=Ureibacillus yapensis TaxID=2304605 RepID=A0A396SGW5_9BACL|nr:alpha-ketoacid dehydrogenase subunit beta [Lysinibacillus yapensis]RHW38317.1 alpha-ketoacid dehydrogenase subunit beta [Lysinibacillus yapensis]
MANLTMVEAIRDALKVEMENNESVILLGEDIGKNGGVFRATDGLIDMFGEERVVDTPLAESGIVGASVGLAINHMRPVAEIQFLGFIYETMDQICAQAARVRFRSAGRFSAPLVIRSPFGGGVRTPELHADSLEALFAHTPGLKVVMPSNPYDAKGLLISAIRDENPVLFLEPMKLYRASREEVPSEAYTVPLHKANIIQSGDEITIVAYGPTVPIATSVANEYLQKGISIEVIDLRTIYPIDFETIIASVEKTGRLIIVHEAVKTGGVGGEIAAHISQHAFFSLRSPITRVTGYDTPYPVASVEDDWLPNVVRLREAIEESLNC